MLLEIYNNVKKSIQFQVRILLHRRKGAAPPNAAPRVKKSGAVKDKLFSAFISRRGEAPAMINSEVYLFYRVGRGAASGGAVALDKAFLSPLLFALYLFFLI